MVVEGQDILLLAERCAYWSQASTLLVADLHLGKAEAMRELGAALPAEAILEGQLRQLSRAIEATKASRVLVLGDLLHARMGLTERMVRRVEAWREENAVTMQLVPGNHDREAERVAARWKLEVLEAVHSEGPFVFVHFPELAGDGFTWAGHHHPAVTLRRGADRLKLPCFRVGTRVAVLPAFSRFTAGGPFSPGAGERVFVIAEEHVVAL